MSAAAWNQTYSHSRKPRMRKRKREVSKNLNTIRRREERKQWLKDTYGDADHRREAEAAVRGSDG